MDPPSSLLHLFDCRQQTTCSQSPTFSNILLFFFLTCNLPETIEIRPPRHPPTHPTSSLIFPFITQTTAVNIFISFQQKKNGPKSNSGRVVHGQQKHRDAIDLSERAIHRRSSFDKNDQHILRPSRVARPLETGSTSQTLSKVGVTAKQLPTPQQLPTRLLFPWKKKLFKFSKPVRERYNAISAT